MRELTKRETQDADLVDINGQLRMQYQKKCRFHGVIVCYDMTEGTSFTAAVLLYKELLKHTQDSSKTSKFSKIPVAFAGTKLDKTDFLKSDGHAVPRCVEVAEVRKWLAKVHHRAENACFETSAVANIGVNMLVDWIARAALRAHPQVEKSKVRECQRFTAPLKSAV